MESNRPLFLSIRETILRPLQQEKYSAGIIDNFRIEKDQSRLFALAVAFCSEIALEVFKTFLLQITGIY